MRKLTALVLFIVLAASAGCAGRHEAKPPIKIAISVWPGYAYAFITKEKGFFEKNGVQVELILKKEQIDSLGKYKEGKVDGLFTVLPEFNSIADLKGKKVSFEGVNTFSNMFVITAQGIG